MLSTPVYLITEAQPAAVIHINVPSDQIQEVMGPAIQEVIAAVSSQGIGPMGSVFAHHFGMTPGVFNFEVGVPVSDPVTPVGRVKAGEMPGATIMRCTYTGPYEGLGEAWEQFQDQLKAEGRTIGPNLWEVYARGPEAGGDPSTYQTELNQTIVE